MPRTMLKIVLRMMPAAVIAGALLLAAGHPAMAQRGSGAPWCLQYKGPGMQGQSPDCSYASLRQCREAAAGNVGTCMRNPYSSYYRR